MSRRLYIIGAVILLVGYLAGFLVWRSQNDFDQAGGDQAPLGALDSRSATRQIEMNYGKMGDVMEGTLEWIHDQTHGKNLVRLLIASSSIAAIVCFILASKWQEPSNNT